MQTDGSMLGVQVVCFSNPSSVPVDLLRKFGHTKGWDVVPSLFYNFCCIQETTYLGSGNFHWFREYNPFDALCQGRSGERAIIGVITDQSCKIVKNDDVTEKKLGNI